MESIVITMTDIEEQLSECEHPFRWQPRTILEVVPYNMMDKLLSNNPLETNNCFTMDLVLMYEYEQVSKIDKALEIVEALETDIISVEPENRNEHAYTAALHIIFSSKAFLLTRKGDLKFASKVMLQMPKITDMSVANRANSLSLRPSFSENMASADSKNRKIRRIERPQDPPLEEEEKYLLSAMSQWTDGNINLVELTLVAQMYWESSRNLCRQKFKNGNKDPEVKRKIQKLSETSLALIKECIRLEPTDVSVMFKCAKGLLKLPKPYCDLNLAKEMLDKGLKMLPEDPYGNHCMAHYYEKKRDIENAIKYLKLCEGKYVFEASMDLFRHEYQLGKVTDVIQRLEGLLIYYVEQPRACTILSHLVAYSLLVLDDLAKACEYARRVLDIFPQFAGMTEHKVIHYKPKHVLRFINLYEFLVDEIKIQQLERTCSEEDKIKYDNFLEYLSMKGISVSSSKSPRNLKNNFKKCSVPPTQARTSWRSNAGNSRPQNPFSVPVGNERSSQYASLGVRYVYGPPKDEPPLSWRRNSRGPTVAKVSPQIDVSKTGSDIETTGTLEQWKTN